MAFSLKKTAAAALLGAAALTPATTQAQGPYRTVPVSQVSVPMSDARAYGEYGVRGMAALGTETYPNIALFGVSREAWPAIKQAIEETVADGYRIRAIFMGPTDAAPSLEVYADGGHVNAQFGVPYINPNTVTTEQLKAAVRQAYRVAYRWDVAQAPEPDGF